MSTEQALVKILFEKNLKIATVESCTGGLVASSIVSVPGASDVLNFSLVTYSNEAKMKLAGVSGDTLDKFTAVSEQTAIEMVKCPDYGLGANVVISVTGYAGPSTADDPTLGLVYIACNVNGNIKCEEHHFTGERNKVREDAKDCALKLALDMISSTKL